MRSRILMISEPGTDGVFRHVEGLCKYLLQEKRDVRVDMAYSSLRGCDDLFALVRLIESRGGRTLDLKIGNGPRPADFQALLRTRRFIREIRPDLIHCHSSKAGGLGRLLKPILPADIPMIYSPHAYFGLSGSTTVKARVYNLVERALSRQAHTINISEDEHRFGVERLGVPADRSTILTHGVDTDHFKPVGREEKARLRKEFGLEEDDLVLGIIGRMGPQKDYPTAYRSIARVVDAEKRVEFKVFQAGIGEQAEELRELAADLGIAERIVRTAYMNDVVEFYQAVDGLLMTSIYEAGIPYVAMEALSCDLPVIISECPGLRTLKDHDLSHAWYAPMGDDRRFAEAIGNWLESYPHRGINHREHALEHFDYRTAFEGIFKYYNSDVVLAG